MLSGLVDQIANKAKKACKRWAETEETYEGLVLYPLDGGAPVVLDDRRILDGIESFAELNLKHEDAKFRDFSRKVKREQYGSIKLNNKIVSSVVQFGVFGFEVF